MAGTRVAALAAMLVLVVAQAGPCRSAAHGAIDLATVTAADRRAADIGYRLAKAATPLCARSGYTAGLELALPSQFEPDVRAQVRAALGLADRPTVSAVAAGGPADRAGVRPRDEIVAVDGVGTATDLLGGPSSAAPVEAAVAQLATALDAGRATLDVRRAGLVRQVALVADRVCAVRLVVVVDRRVRGGTDDHDISLTVGLLAFAQNDDEAAAIAGHELAHVILADRAGRARRGGQRQREVDADRLGIVLAAEAGYRADAAVAFWRRFGRHDALERLRAADHPGAAARANAAAATAVAIARDGAAAVAAQLLARYPPSR